MPQKKAKDFRELTMEERGAALNDYKKELMYERGIAAMGGAPANPGKIRSLRTSIARLETVKREIEDAKVMKEDK